MKRATRPNITIICNDFKFQSTPSVKRATAIVRGHHIQHPISIHTLCEEGDLMNRQYNQNIKFQSTPSVKRATKHGSTTTTRTAISIHTLCEEGDIGVTTTQRMLQSISIHTLCEEGDNIQNRND